MFESPYTPSDPHATRHDVRYCEGKQSGTVWSLVREIESEVTLSWKSGVQNFVQRDGGVKVVVKDWNEQGSHGWVADKAILFDATCMCLHCRLRGYRSVRHCEDESCLLRKLRNELQTSVQRVARRNLSPILACQPKVLLIVTRDSVCI